MRSLRWGVLSDSELADCSDNGDDAIYICAVARCSLRGILKGKQNPSRVTPLKRLNFYDKPYVREYEAAEAKIIVWRIDFPQPYGSTKHGRHDPVTKPHRQKSLYAYAVGRLRAIHLANGEGRIDDEEGPGGWDGADVHKNENRQQPILWIPEHAVLFVPTDPLASYGRKKWPTTQGVGTMSIYRETKPLHTLTSLPAPLSI